MKTRITIDNIAESALPAISGGIKVTSVVSTNSTYGALQSNTVNATSGGFLKVIGSGFANVTQVYIGTDAPTLATSISFISSTEVRAVVPARAAGSYLVYVVRTTDGSFASVINGVTYA
jgi:hypothetical protein